MGSNYYSVTGETIQDAYAHLHILVPDVSTDLFRISRGGIPVWPDYSTDIDRQVKNLGVAMRFAVRLSRFGFRRFGPLPARTATC